MEIPFDQARSQVADQAESSSEMVEKPSGYTILIVDDDPIFLNMISMMVAVMGYSSLQAKNGQEAVECFQAHPDRIGLVIMDVEMPRLDGIKATQKLRQIDPSVKVILLSGRTQQGVWQAKPDAFLLKSFMHLELHDLICKFIAPDAIQS